MIWAPSERGKKESFPNPLPRSQAGKRTYGWFRHLSRKFVNIDLALGHSGRSIWHIVPTILQRLMRAITFSIAAKVWYQYSSHVVSSNLADRLLLRRRPGLTSSSVASVFTASAVTSVTFSWQYYQDLSQTNPSQTLPGRGPRVGCFQGLFHGVHGGVLRMKAGSDGCNWTLDWSTHLVNLFNGLGTGLLSSGYPVRRAQL